MRIDTGGADLVLGADLVVAARGDVLDTIENGRTRAIVNDYETPTADFTLNRDFDMNADALRDAISNAAGRANTTFFDATDLATALFGDSIATNLFLLGFACQRGTLPVSVPSLERAIAEAPINAVEMAHRGRTWTDVAARVRGADAVPASLVQNPLLMSGLAFSGANQRASANVVGHSNTG